MTSRILIVEDEEDLLKGLQRKLAGEGYTVLVAATGERGLEIARQERPDIILLDIMLPGMDGLEVCRRLRAEKFSRSIIMLTAKSEEIDRVVGLEIGADDYVTKPFSMRELLARIRARLRSQPERRDEVDHCRIGTTEIDFRRFTAIRGTEALTLTAKEYDILQLLARHRGQVVSRRRLLGEVWGYSASATTRTVDTHILRLRQKLEDDPANPRYIQTVYGAGYRLAG